MATPTQPGPAPLGAQHAFDKVFEVIYDPMQWPSEWLQARKGGHPISLSAWEYLTEVVDGFFGIGLHSSVNTSPADVADFSRAEFEYAVQRGHFSKGGMIWSWANVTAPVAVAAARVSDLRQMGSGNAISAGGIQHILRMPAAQAGKLPTKVVLSGARPPLSGARPPLPDIDEGFNVGLFDELLGKSKSVVRAAPEPVLRTPAADDPYYVGHKSTDAYGREKEPRQQYCYLDGRRKVSGAGEICEDCREKYLNRVTLS